MQEERLDHYLSVEDVREAEDGLFYEAHILCTPTDALHIRTEIRDILTSLGLNPRVEISPGGEYEFVMDDETDPHDMAQAIVTLGGFADQEACGTDYMAGQTCVLPWGHDGAHR